MTVTLNPKRPSSCACGHFRIAHPGASACSKSFFCHCRTFTPLVTPPAPQGPHMPADKAERDSMIRGFLAEGWSRRAIADRLLVSDSVVARVVRRERAEGAA